MTAQFCLAFASSLVFLLAPGTAILRAFRPPAVLSIACAPSLSTCLYVLAGTATARIGLLGAVPLLALALAVCVLICCIGAKLVKAGPVHKQPEQTSLRNALLPLALYALVGLVAVYIVFLRPMDGLDSFVQYDDNATHLGLIASMVDGGNYSILSTTPYAATLPTFQTPFNNASFYPNGWHIITALSCLVSSASIPVAENAVNVAFVSVIFPLGVAALLSTIFPENKPVLVAGAFACMLSVAFPLRMLTVHGPFPNLAAFCYIPSVCVLFIRAFSPSESRPLNYSELPAFLLGSIGLAATHPNAIFSCVVLLLPYFVSKTIPSIMNARTREALSTRSVRTVLAQVLMVVAIVAIWLLLLQSKPFASVSNFIWEFQATPGEEILNTLTAGYYLGIAQPILAALIAIGFFSCLRKKGSRWIAVSYVLSAAVFVLGTTLDYQMRKLITGYWYNDPERTAALLAIAAIPLSAMGLAQLGKFLSHLIERNARQTSPRQTSISVIAVVLAAIPLSALNYVLAPITRGDVSAYSFAGGQVAGTYNFNDAQVYSVRERAFVQKALEIIPEGSLVLNLPHDGSVFAYPSEGMNVYYKSCRPSGETDESYLIRTKLNTIASDEEVRDAVKKTGARYVLLLEGVDQTASELYTPLATYHADMWEGLVIDNETPGFTCILEDGPLKLYSIDV